LTQTEHTPTQHTKLGFSFQLHQQLHQVSTISSVNAEQSIPDVSNQAGKGVRMNIPFIQKTLRTPFVTPNLQHFSVINDYKQLQDI